MAAPADSTVAPSRAPECKSPRAARADSITDLESAIYDNERQAYIAQVFVNEKLLERNVHVPISQADIESTFFLVDALLTAAKGMREIFERAPYSELKGRLGETASPRRGPSQGQVIALVDFASIVQTLCDRLLGKPTGTAAGGCPFFEMEEHEVTALNAAVARMFDLAGQLQASYEAPATVAA